MGIVVEFFDILLDHLWGDLFVIRLINGYSTVLVLGFYLGFLVLFHNLMFLCYGYVYHSDVISLKQTTEAYSSEMIVKPEEYFVIKWYSKAFF